MCYVCVYIYTYIYILYFVLETLVYIYKYIYIYMYIYFFKFWHLFIYLCIHTIIHSFIHSFRLFIYLFIFIFTHICIHAFAPCRKQDIASLKQLHVHSHVLYKLLPDPTQSHSHLHAREAIDRKPSVKISGSLRRSSMISTMYIYIYIYIYISFVSICVFSMRFSRLLAIWQYGTQMRMQSCD